MPLYDKATWQLMREMVADLGLAKGEVISKRSVLQWFEKNYPKIQQNTVSAHLIRMSTNAPTRIHYQAKPDWDDLFFKIDGSHFRLYDKSVDPPPIYGDSKKKLFVKGKGGDQQPTLEGKIFDLVQGHTAEWQSKLEEAENQLREIRE